MVEESQAAQSGAQRVFVSYSRSDRTRVTGLGLLLEALGHHVFLDHKTIMPGTHWEAKLQEGLDQADVLLVYWTKYASRSEWVRKEVEYFHAHFPDHLLVPVLGDETPLSELLKPHQHNDFCPLINELLDLKRSMEQQKAKPEQVQEAILTRLREAGIEIKERDRKKLFRLFALTGFLGLVTAPLAFLQQLGNSTMEAIAQLSGAQAALVGAAAVSGALICGVVDMGASRAFRITNVEYPKKVVSGAARVDLAVTYSGQPVFPVEMIFRPRSCPQGGTCRTARTTFQKPTGNQRLVAKSLIGCYGTQDPSFDYEVVLRDSTGVEVSEPTPAECVSQSVRPRGRWRP